MRKLLLLVAVVGSMSVASAAPPGKDFCAELRRRDPRARCKSVEIEPERLTGNVVAPLGDTAVGRGEMVPGSLIRVRTDFVDKIVASANNL
jgi:hypothetical protein